MFILFWIFWGLQNSIQKAYIWLSPLSSQMSEACVKKDVMGCYERQKASPSLIWTFQNHWDFNLFSSVWMVKIPAIFDSLGTELAIYITGKKSFKHLLLEATDKILLFAFYHLTFGFDYMYSKDNKNKKPKKKNSL